METCPLDPRQFASFGRSYSILLLYQAPGHAGISDDDAKSAVEAIKNGWCEASGNEIGEDNAKVLFAGLQLPA